ISIISPISNMLMCVAISGVLNLGLMTVAVSFMPAVADMTGTVTGWLADYCISVSKWLASFKFSVVSIDHIFVGLWIVSVMLIFTVVAILIAKGKTIFKAHTVRVGAYISCIMLVCFVFVNYMVNKDVTTVNLLDSGSSYSAVITRGGSAFIVGTGGESAHLAYRELDDRLQIKNVDIMILPDLKNNYSQKAQNVVKWSKPDKILMDNVSDRYYQIESVAKENSIIPLKDSVITLWNDVVITPYYLPSSVAIKVMIGDTSLLFVDGKASVSLLPDDFANSHITVVSGVPEKAEQIKSEYIVACCDEQTEFISTADGNIQILTRGNGDIKMKRMR
ncbi:MAG: hypothetical protein IJN31_08645, partial [Peptococcaceae bacterium]|nr:hypothetical protein [Peptococcaceae bacterium]